MKLVVSLARSGRTGDTFSLSLELLNHRFYLNTGRALGTPLPCQCNFRQNFKKHNVDLRRILLGIGESYFQNIYV